MSKNSKLYVTGKTEDGRPMIGGWFAMVATYGIPIDTVISYLDDSGHMPDWLEFYFTAVSEGWNAKRTIGRLRQAVADVYGPEFREGWSERFEPILKRLEVENERERKCSGDSG
jgi:hypothetical protein